MTTYAATWPDPVTGHPAYSFHADEAAAEAEAQRLVRTGIARATVIALEEER